MKARIAILAAVLFTAIAIAVRTGVTETFDRAVLIGMWRPHLLRQMALDLTSLGSTTIIFLVVAIAASFLAITRRGREAILLSGCAVSGYVVMQVLKHIFDRARPEVVPHAVLTTGASFPSGHAMLSALTYLTLAGIVTRSTTRSRRLFCWSLASVLILVIGLTRLYLGVHWPTDVLAGWCAGTAWSMLWLSLPIKDARRPGVR